MNDLEILAELKIAYRQLDDIIENTDNEQITHKEYSQLRIAMDILEVQYKNTYKRIEEKNKNSLFYAKNILIANEIYNDYVTKSNDYDDQYITYAEMDNRARWWEDYDFLLK